MKSILPAALIVVIFTLAIKTYIACKPAEQFTGKTEKCTSHVDRMASPPRYKGLAGHKCFKTFVRNYLAGERCEHRNYKTAASTASDNKASFGPAELTLEYLTVQLSGSYALE